MHFADNLKLTLGNKTGKISPLYDIINKNLVQFDVFYSLISIRGVSQRYSPPLELNPKGLGKKQKYCYKLY